MNVIITLNAGLGGDLGPNFNLTANVGVVTPDTATLTELLAGKLVDVDGAVTSVTITSTGTCTNSLTLPVSTPGSNIITVYGNVRDGGTYLASVYYKIDSGSWISLIGNHTMPSCFDTSNLGTIAVPSGSLLSLAFCYPTSSGDYKFYGSTSASDSCNTAVTEYCGQANPFTYTVTTSISLYLTGFQTPTTC